VEKIRTPDDLRDALLVIVDDNGKLIRKKPIATPNYEVAARADEIGRHGSL
jgi:hypothetical protein